MNIKETDIIDSLPVFITLDSVDKLSCKNRSPQYKDLVYMNKATDKSIHNQKIVLGIGAALVAIVAIYLSTLVVSDIPMGDYEAGVHYQQIEKPRRISGNKIEVLEVFSYSCIHCFRLDPDLAKWVEQNSERINFIRIPAISNEAWRVQARAYYATEVLGITEVVHLEFFHAIHDKKINLNSIDRIANFMDGRGTTAEQFTKTYHSVNVTNKVTEADRLQRRYQVAAVPAMIVNGKYRVNTSQQVGRSRILDVVEHLVDKELAEKSSKITES